MKRKILSFFALAFAAALALAAEAAPQSRLLNRNGLRGPGGAGAPAAAKPGAPAAAKPSPSAGVGGGDEAPQPTGNHALNWENAPSDLILMAYGDELGKTILKDPACPAATITLKSKQGQKLSREDYLEAIETVLEMNGIHLEPYKDSFIRALPRKDVRKEGIPILMDSETKLGESGKVVSMMIPFENMTAEDAQKVLEGFKSNSGLLIVFERTNKILVTDTEQNINRMLEIARAIDVATPATEQVFVRQIKNASVEDVQKALQAIVDDAMKWQEKNKSPTNAQGQQQPFSRPQPGARRGLLGRNQPQQQPAAPVSNESLVMSVSDADRGVIRGRVLLVPDERSNKLVIITSKSNMDFFDKVIEQLDVETTPDTVVKVYRLKYADAEDVSDMINDLIGNSSSSQNKSKNQNQTAKKGANANVTRNNAQTSAAKKPANQRSGDAKAGELSKDNTTVLADKRINGLVVMTDKELVPTIEQIIESMDIKLSQVLIETVIIEVGLGGSIKTGIDWVNNNWTGKDPKIVGGGGGGDNSATVTSIRGGSKTYAEYYQEAKNILGSNASQSEISSLVTQLMNEGATGLYTGSPATAGILYFLRSDKLNLSAVLQASQSDSRTKYIASPVVMTVDNKEAIIEATQSRKFYSGSTSSANYSTSVSYSYTDKDIGIKIKVTPKINPNGTVMLEVEEEYSQVGPQQEMLVSSASSSGTPSKENVDTSLTRKMSADILLENMQTAVLGGLTSTQQSEVETGIPILKDIPWIGKYLFGSTSVEESRSELLVFLTPYVLSDAETAQMEALRRKKALSDPRPWDDHGWSASQLADPVSKKEQLRRLQDEWKKQDAERQTRLAIEQEKVKRAQKLKGLSVEERNLWLKMHKDELEEEAQEELEEKMLDDKSQEELKKLAAEIRAKKLAESEKELKKAADETAAENERGKRDAEKKATAAESVPAPVAPPPAAASPAPTPETPETPASAASILGEIDAM